MKHNVSKNDMIIRIIIAVIIALMGMKFGIWWLYILALIPLFTGIFKMCPIYSIFGMSTCCKMKEMDKTKDMKK